MSDPEVTFTVRPDGGLRFRTDRPACDFCRVELRRSWSRFACEDFTTLMESEHGVVRFTSEGFWAGCGTCAPLVRGRRWVDLADRVLGRLALLDGEPTVEEAGVHRRLLSLLYLELSVRIGCETVVRDRSSTRRGRGCRG